MKMPIFECLKTDEDGFKTTNNFVNGSENLRRAG